MSKALFFTAVGKTLLITAAWIVFNLTLLDIMFIMFSVDLMTALIASWIWKD